MNGTFSQEAMEAFAAMVGEENFSESLFDFTTCKRPDGSNYGTGGKCRKGTEISEKPEKPIPLKQLRANIKAKKAAEASAAANPTTQKKELTENQKALQKESLKKAQDFKKIAEAHKAHAADLRKQGREEEAKASDEVVAHHTRLMNDALRAANNPAKDVKMQIDINTPEGRWFARRRGF